MPKQQKKILIVEDNATIRRVTRAILALDFEVFEAVDAIETLQMVIELQPDMILMDIMMPKLNGIDACRHLKQNIATAHIPVIILSALTSCEWKEAASKAGAACYLTKPITKTTLLQATNEILRTGTKQAIEMYHR